jgi:hypothetical protein
VTEDKGFYRAYVPKVFKGEALKILTHANTIIAEYEGQGIPLSLRQLYYQMVSRALIANRVQSYSRLGHIIADGRLAGLVSWTAIEDRERELLGTQTWKSPGEALNNAKTLYRRDKWEDQPVRPEIWVEKRALVNVVGQIAEELQVDFYATKGYDSLSQLWRAGRRFAQYVSKGQRPVVLHFADHDPSGLDMTRVIDERLALLAGFPVQVVRLALNMNQIEQYDPPPNPAKIDDPRFVDYQARYGNESWELDALEPRVLKSLISDAVLRLRNHELWDAALKREAEETLVIEEAAEMVGGAILPPDGEKNDD